MLTRNKLSISVAISLAAAVFMGAALFHAVQRVNRALDDSEAHFELVKHLTQRRFALADFVSSGQERARLQWEGEYREIDRILSQFDPANIDAEVLERVGRNQLAIRSVFDRLVTTSKEAGNQRNAEREEFRQRLVSQLIARSQDMISDALRLGQRSTADMHAALRETVLLAALVTVLGMVLVAVNWFIVWKDVLRPLKRLEAATASIAGGDLKRRTGIASKDEIGALARSFDVMTTQLQATDANLRVEIAGHKKANDALDASARDLARSNAELEQFAYVASHDLQEPLRMVVGYVQLLEKRLADKFDADTREFMGFAVDGALRMQHLIRDILAYSRVGTRGSPVEPVDSAAAFKEALALLASRIAETGAEVSAPSLPIVTADRVQLVQLFQNLIGNAIKFCKDGAPRVRVEAHRGAGRWRFSVSDNGIGIAPEYRDRIFGIFQRLHTRRVFPGTGIGLAICKRIVERHGGEIGVEPTSGGGSAFWFTLPEEKSS